MFDDHGYPKMSGIVHGQSSLSPKNMRKSSIDPSGSAKDILL